jgi:hypothetical protein
MTKTKLKKISEHCHAIADSIPPEEFILVRDWLNIAAAIKEVQLNFFQFDESVGYCESADDALDETQALLTANIFSLTRFIYIWNALESFLKVLKLKRLDKSENKYHVARLHLNKYFSEHSPIESFKQTFEHFCEVTKLSFHKDVIEKQKIHPENLIEAQGLQIIQELRNEFAHGELLVPNTGGLPGENARRIDTHAIDLASRIILFSIQMLLLIAYEKRELKLEIQDRDSGDENELSIEIWLHRLHLIDDDLKIIGYSEK